MKVCTKCKRELPKTAFSKNGLGKGGLRGKCKDCQHEYGAAYYAAHREERAARHATYYVTHREERATYRASHKEEIAARVAAYYASHKEEITAREAAYRASHKEESIARSAAYYAANAEKIRARHLADYAANPEKMRARRAAWAASHKEEIAAYYQENKERMLACGAAYHAAHPEKARARKACRRARELNLPTEDFTRLEILERDGWICQLCGEPILESLAWPHPRSASLDHIKPLAKGGHHTRANTQATHLVCNLRKGSNL